MTPEHNNVAPVERSQPPVSYLPVQNYPEVPASFLRCPIPPIGIGPVDNLRQFYNKGAVPQFRVQTINAATPTGALLSSGTATTTTSSEATSSNTSNSNISSSSSKTKTTGSKSSIGTVTTTTTTSNVGRVFTASITTPVLNPNQIFSGTFTMAKTYGVVSVAVTAAARVRLYTSSTARSSDIGRPANLPVVLGNPTGLVGEWLLTASSEFLWFCSPMAIGFNADQPASTNVYASISNPVSTSNPIQVSITYIVLES